MTAATLRYLTHGYGSPVLLIHTATAPNAVLHVLPALPRELWPPSLAAVWAASAAITSMYGPPSPRPLEYTPPHDADDMLDRAWAHGDEHVIKFTDTAAEVFARTTDPRALAADHAIRLLERS
ncbi:MAG: hypothetical protein ACM3ML_28415 [Micromonosporaceae bacterium]